MESYWILQHWYASIFMIFRTFPLIILLPHLTQSIWTITSCLQYAAIANWIQTAHNKVAMSSKLLLMDKMWATTCWINTQNLFLLLMCNLLRWSAELINAARNTKSKVFLSDFWQERSAHTCFPVKALKLFPYHFWVSTQMSWRIKRGFSILSNFHHCVQC